jgi:hypothetical protein
MRGNCLTLQRNRQKLFLEIITLVSSVNKIGSDEVFIVGGRLFICYGKQEL